MPAPDLTILSPEIVETTNELALRVEPFSDARPWREDLVLSEIHYWMESMIHAAYQIGRRLLWTKAVLPHGDFEAWCADKLPLSERTIRNYMRVATFLTDHPRLLEPMAKAGVKRTLLLTSLPKELLDEIDEQGLVAEVPVEMLGEVPYVELRKQVEQLKKERDDYQDKLALTEKKLERTREALGDQAVERSKMDEYARKVLDEKWPQFEQLIDGLCGDWAILGPRWDEIPPALRTRLVGMAEAIVLHTKHEMLALRMMAGEEVYGHEIAECLKLAQDFGHPIPDGRVLPLFGEGQDQ